MVAAYLILFDPRRRCPILVPRLLLDRPSGPGEAEWTVILTTLTPEFWETKKYFQLQFFWGILNPLSDFQNSSSFRFSHFPNLDPRPVLRHQIAREAEENGKFKKRVLQNYFCHFDIFNTQILRNTEGFPTTVFLGHHESVVRFQKFPFSHFGSSSLHRAGAPPPPQDEKYSKKLCFDISDDFPKKSLCSKKKNLLKIF